jgi:hypothetical protein
VKIQRAGKLALSVYREGRMKAIEITLAGQKYYLAFTGEARYALNDLCGDQTILELSRPDTREALDYLCKAVSILIEQGELARRYMGYDKGAFLDSETIKAIVTPSDIQTLKVDLAKAIVLGYGREVESDEKEVDLVLQELEKKTTKG